MSFPVYDGADVKLPLVDGDAWSAVEAQVSEGGWVAGEWLECLEVLGDLSLGSCEQFEQLGLALGDLLMLGLQLGHLHLAPLAGEVKFRQDLLLAMGDVVGRYGFAEIHAFWDLLQNKQ